MESWLELGQHVKGLKVCVTEYTFVHGYGHAWQGAETPAASAARAFSTARRWNPAGTHFDSKVGYQGQTGAVDDRLDQ